MARTEARIAVAIWSDPDFLRLSPGAQRQFMFVLSQPDLAHDGVIALRERRWSKSAAGLTAAQVAANLDELKDARFVVVDEDAEELLVRSFIRRDKVYRQPNVLRAAADHLKGITSQIILRELAAELDRIAAGDDVPAASMGFLAEMRAVAAKGSGKGSENPSGNPSGKGSPDIDERSDIVSPSGTDALIIEVGQSVIDSEESPGAKGSGNPSGNPSPGTPGERGVVTAVTTASPSPVPRASDPRPRPSAGGRADAREHAASPPDGPPSKCPDHIDDPDPPDCGRCAGARKARTRWEIAEAERRRNAPRCTKHRGQPAHNCALCRAESLGADDEETP